MPDDTETSTRRSRSRPDPLWRYLSEQGFPPEAKAFLNRVGFAQRIDPESGNEISYLSNPELTPEQRLALITSDPEYSQHPQDLYGLLRHGTSGTPQWGGDQDTGEQQHGFLRRDGNKFVPDLEGDYARAPGSVDDHTSGPDVGIANKYRGQSVYDPLYGWVIPRQAHIDFTTAQGDRNLAEFDFGKAAVMAMASLGAGYALGPGFAGFDAMGTAIPGIAEGTTALQHFTGGNNPFSNMFTQSGSGSEPWGVNPQFTIDNATGLPVENDFGASGLNEFGTMTGNALPSSSNFVPGSFGLGTTAAGGAAASGLGSGGGMWSSFLSDLIKPSTLIPAAGQIFSAITGANAASNALDAQLDATGQAIGEQRRQYDQTRQDLMPWLRAGTLGIGTLAERTLGPNADLTRRFTMADLAADPVYQTSNQFGMDEGIKAIDRKFSASGGLDSGAAAKAIARFATDYAGTRAGDSFNRYQAENTNLYNRIAGVAGTGQTAANTVANAGANAANNVSSALIGGGNASAAAGIAGSNAVSGAINNFSNFWQNQQLLNRLPMYTMS